MCGIFSYFGTNYSDAELINFANKIKHRGPDSTTSKRINDKLFFTFHRLAINGLNPESDQPLVKDGVYLICNGEIFNFKNLIKSNNFENIYKTESDCEIILHLYIKFGIEETCKLLDGEFAFVLYDSNKDILFSARDQIGVRSLYWSKNINNDEICFCSELKGMPLLNNIQQFPPSSYWQSDNNKITNLEGIPATVSRLSMLDNPLTTFRGFPILTRKDLKLNDFRLHNSIRPIIINKFYGKYKTNRNYDLAVIKTLADMNEYEKEFFLPDLN